MPGMHVLAQACQPPQKQQGSGDTGEPTTRQKTRRAHRRPAEQEKAAQTGLLQPVGTALQRLTGMHKSRVTGHSAYLSASTAPGTDGDVEVLWYSSQVRAVHC